ncbi:Na(+)/H(+) antiporter subunit B [Kitasatospora sp. NPDC098663]|uniref:Na(+)/H(+) antiporter subunit B n=1 Tax=Kitasatospora sp. NPDC098663 TaxID=3364096 RepID=UPI003828A9B7
MNEWLIGAALAFVVIAATTAVLTRDPARQAVVLSALGLGLAVLFAVLQAPDVALSQLAVGTALTPLLILLSVRKVTRRPTGRTEPTPDDHGAGAGQERG